MAEKSFVEIQSRLSAIDVTQFIEKKKDGDGKSYISWANAWGMLIKEFPEAEYEIRWFGEENNKVPYLKTKEGYMVFTSVTVCGHKREMWLPVQDSHFECLKEEPYKITYSSGKVVTIAAADMNDVNKAIMRCLVKNLAMFGLGLYIYAGEDLPEDIKEYVCADCGVAVDSNMAQRTQKAFGVCLCKDCGLKRSEQK